MKRNKKGFTLVELLAIITILAIISVITTPVVLKVIENAKKGAAINSALGYKDAIHKYYTTKQIKNHEFSINGEFDITNEGELSNESEEHQIVVKGTTPSGGYAIIDSGKLTDGCVQINEYAVRFENGSVSNTIKGNCTEAPLIVDEFPQVQDTNPGIICGNGTTEDYDNSSICYIYSVEDLVAFSSMVNSGKSFSSKTVMLMNNLDIENDKSYANANINSYGDYNEDATTSSTLKEELTTGKGYKPAGNSTNKFSGIFEGNTHTIKNLYINRSSSSYIALIGYNTGKVRGLKVTDAEVTGYDYSALVVGYNTNTSTEATSIIATGSVSGRYYVGLAVGKNSNSGTVEAVTSGDVYSSYTSATSTASAGGIVGEITSGTIKGVVLDGTITTAGSKAYRTVGEKDGSGTLATLASNTVTSQTVNSDYNALDSYSGGTVNSSYIENIGTMERVLDTYVGGDNNSDGYYYDNDAQGHITIYSTTDKPLTRTMAGSGTSADPYIITNYQQFKEASYDVSKCYRLDTDINFQGKNPIMLSSYQNPFTGTFDGNGYTISNITLGGYNYVGLFGYNNTTGKIKGFKLENVNVSARNYAAGVAAYNQGQVSSVIVKGNVSGHWYLGLAAGINKNGGTVEAVTSGDVYSSYTSATSTASAGGIVGEITSGTIKGVVLDGTITTAGSKAYRTVGEKDGSGTLATLASNTVTSQTVNSDYIALDGYSGGTVNSSYIENIGTLERVLDTYVGGDNDSDGYYYDNDETGHVIVRSTLRNPLTITMTGSGTSESPYLITNYNQLKEAAYDVSKYYRLNADINMQGKNPIMLSSYQNKFTGTFDGNGYTISNGTYGGYEYVGLFGYNNTSGKIKGFKLENINVTARDYAAVLAGYNQGQISSIIAKGNVSGHWYLGLAAGINKNGGTVEAVTSGNVTSTYASATSTASAGGIVGEITSGTIKGVVLDGTITTAGSKAYRTVGEKDGSGTLATLASNTVTSQTVNSDYIALDGYSGGTVNSSYIENIGTLSRVLDTYINGDNNSDGYYYDNDENGHVVVRSTLRNPLTRTMAGSGTSADPYIITNYNQLKEAAYDVTKYYRLDADINMQGKNPIMLSSYQQPFTGTFEGNTHTISNGTYGGYEYVGLFGYNNTSGTIKGLKLENINVTARDYAAVLAGHNQGQISNVIVKGNVSGHWYLGLAAGINKNGGTVEAVTSGDVYSSYTSATSTASAGGIVGEITSGTIRGIVLDGTISTAGSKAYRTIGEKNSSGTLSTGASDTVVAPTSATGISSLGGKTYTTAQLQTIAPYTEVGLNTSSTSGTYRFAIDSNNNVCIVKN